MVALALAFDLTSNEDAVGKGPSARYLYGLLTGKEKGKRSVVLTALHQYTDGCVFNSRRSQQCVRGTGRLPVVGWFQVSSNAAILQR